MGDMKGSVRGVDFHRNDAEEDPFAELADIFESEVGRAAFRAPAPSVRGGQPMPAAPVDHDFTAEFADVFAAEMTGTPQRAPLAPAEMSYQSWLSPRGAMQPSGATGEQHVGRLQGPTSVEVDFERAIHGLSAPANPRHATVYETQSFAPERIVDDYRQVPAPSEMDDFDALIASELAAMHHLPARRVAAGAPAFDAARDAIHDDQSTAFDGRLDASNHDDDMGEEEGHATPRPGFLARHARLMAGGVVSLALVGAVGFFTFGSGSSDIGLAASSEPLLIKADAEPYKIAPENPGGRSIPNQNKAVYERVASPDAGRSTTQSALLTQSEEPIELPPEDEPSAYEDLPGVDLVDNEGLGLKDPARLEEVAAVAEDTSPVPVLQPRKVRTMVVRPDGTIVESAPVAAAPLLTAAAQPLPPVTATLASAAPDSAPAAEAPVPVVAEASVPQPLAPQTAAPAGVPYSAALVEEAPAISAPQVQPDAADLPSDPMQVAAIAMVPEAPVEAPVALAPEPPAAPAPELVAAVAPPPPAGSYFVQISSQPSEALAQQSLQSLGSRYASLIEGRSVGIQSAEIPGKGTFYRVRVATASKDEAATLCNRLKSAGGNCFVAR